MKSYLPALLFSIAIVVAVALGANAYRYKFTSSETISITGLAEKNFNSDLVVWEATFTRKNTDLRTTYSSLKNDEACIRQYLKENGVDDSSIVFSSVTINKDFEPKFDNNGHQTGAVFTGYNLSQTVTLQSKDISRIEKISREITELIEKGIELNSSNPRYYYTRLSDLKLDLLAKASEDARKRAEIIAKNAGSRLGNIRKATMGVFQITGQYSNEDFSYGGTYNTVDKNKSASITIKAEYELK